MPHFDHDNSNVGIEKLVENPIRSNTTANTVPLLSGQFLTTGRTRIITQGSDSLYNTTDIVPSVCAALRRNAV